jgi:hypothetical protein
MPLSYGRFVVENLALFDYKSSDEVLVVIYNITQVLPLTGESALHQIEDMLEGKADIEGVFS